MAFTIVEPACSFSNVPPRQTCGSPHPEEDESLSRLLHTHICRGDTQLFIQTAITIIPKSNSLHTIHDNIMDGFPREEISRAKDLRDMIICTHVQAYVANDSSHVDTAQLRAVFGPGNQVGSFDVIHFRDGKVFVARAIAYPHGVDGSNNFSTWTMLIDGRSEEGVFYALEDLWTMTQVAALEIPLSKNAARLSKMAY